jgi:hypothetical protein
MSSTTIIIILAIILLILIALNNIKIIKTDTTSQAKCSQTTFGCCPDGINSKVNYYGTNCPQYNPGPGYYPTPQPVPVPVPQPVPVPKPVPVPVPVPKPIPVPAPEPLPKKPIGGCSGTRYGCCPDNYTPKVDEQGSNCIIKS